jgi:hypothetical protein
MMLGHGPMRATLVFLAFSALSGCTSALIEGAKSKDVDLSPNALALKLVSASVLQDARDTEEPGSRVYLCLSRKRLPDGPEESRLVGLSLPYPFTNELDQNLGFRKEGDGLVLESGLVTVDGCAATGKTLVRQLPIVEADGLQRVEVPENQQDAIVVSYRTVAGLGLGYISIAPILGGYHSFMVDLRQTPLYAEHRGARPYLLLLTPITAVGDALLATYVLSVVTIACADKPGPCY